MALYKGNKRYALSTNNPGNVIPLEVTKDGIYTAPSGVSGYNPVTMKNNNTFAAMGPHTDANGIWHKPAEWDDIESIDLGDRQEVYFLCACHKNEYNWFRIRAYGSGMTWSYGHVSNGIYTLHANSTETSVSNGGYVSLFLNNMVDDYIVVRLKATTSINSCTYQAWAATADLNYAMPFKCQSVLMRYGRMPKGTSLANSATYCLESDNIIDFAKDYQNTTTVITINNAYEDAISLQRWRYTGWNIAINKVTNLKSIFYHCYCLCDAPNPLNLNGWCTSNVTSLSSMFDTCISLNTTILVNNWDLSNVTTIAAMFYQCRSLKSIKGLDTWSTAPKCTTISNLFYLCYSLTSKLDLSKLYLGNGTANFVTFGSVFYNCASCPEINISNINFSKVTSLSGAFTGTSNCKNIIMNNITVPTVLCTSFNNAFNGTAVTEITIDGWDFSYSSAGNNLAQSIAYTAYGIKKFIFRNCTSPSATINDTTAQFSFRYCYNLEYLDISFLDLSVFSNTTTYNQSFRDLYCLVDFYPPQNISKSFNLTNDMQLSHDSLMRVINNLVTLASGTTATLTIGAYNLWKLTSAEKAIATNKGWTLA